MSGTTTISGTYTSGITLSSIYTTITGAGSVGNTAVDGNAVSGPGSTTWTLVNSGLISETAAGGVGVNLAQYGIITNATGGTITATNIGVEFTGAAGSVTNSGIISVGNIGVYLLNGGVITNLAGGTIVSSSGHDIVTYGDATVVNAGQLSYTAGVGGVYLNAGIGSVTNQSGGVITGLFSGVYEYSGTVSNAGYIGGIWAVKIGHAATVINQSGGTISGGTDSVVLSANYANLVVDDPGSVFTNTVDGGYGGPLMSILELASGSSAGTISGLGTQFIDFQQVAVDAGANWTFSGTNAITSGVTLTNSGTDTVTGALTNDGLINGNGAIGIGLGVTLIDTGVIAAGQTIAFTGTSGMLDVVPAGFYATIGNFQAGDTIALSGINDITAHTVINGNTLDLTRSGGSHIDLTLDRNYTTADFATTVDGANTDITTTTVTCFAAGTALDTPDGSVAVEVLRVGDLVLTATGQARPIRWIGRRRVDIKRHPDPRTVRPIRILANALADGSPRRDLLLSPDHALLLDGMLIPARLLRNDATIRREEHCSAVIYYHVELETHDVLLAEGAAAESYLDTGNRDSFENSNLPVRLHPDLAGGQHRRETESCAPFVADPARTEPVWRRLAQRAVQLDHTTPEPRSGDADLALHIVCAGRSFAPIAVVGTRHTFLLPAWQGALRLRSGCVIPNEVTPWIEDQRRLGVMIRQLTVTTASDTRTIPVDDTAVGSGWWDVERDDGAMWRWTNGDAAIAIASAGPCRLDIEVAGTATFARRPAVAPTTLAA